MQRPQTYTTEYIGRTEIAERTYEWRFRKPDGFDFKAGQFARLTIVDAPYSDTRGNARPMSIASAPSEKELKFAMRVGPSAYKRSLMDLEPGDKVEIAGPYGVFLLPEDKSIPIVFLIGGIGITPVRSMIVDELENNCSRPMCLMYSNRRPQDAPYKEEIDQYSSSICRTVHTMTELEELDTWNGETGFIREELLHKYDCLTPETLYYVVGPNGFIKAMQGMLDSVGVDKSHIKIDNFGAY